MSALRASLLAWLVSGPGARRVAAAAAAFAVAGCGGSGAGNPPAPLSNSTGATQTAAAQVLGAICVKLNACYPALSVASCDAGVEAQTNLAAAFGLSAGYGSFQAIMTAESSGSLQPNAAAETQCLSDLGALSCSSAALEGAYSASSPSDFSEVVDLVPTAGTSCKGLY